MKETIVYYNVFEKMNLKRKTCSILERMLFPELNLLRESSHSTYTCRKRETHEICILNALSIVKMQENHAKTKIYLKTYFSYSFNRYLIKQVEESSSSQH